VGETGQAPNQQKVGETGQAPNQQKVGETGQAPNQQKVGETGQAPNQQKVGETGQVPNRQEEQLCWQSEPRHDAAGFDFVAVSRGPVDWTPVLRELMMQPSAKWDRVCR
ncbi:MAG: hypothetical protein RBU37_20180, partial [Myxococcota bacterium]|nr:hypothetical protein [Myxococcota bacterium]